MRRRVYSCIAQECTPFWGGSAPGEAPIVLSGVIVVLLSTSIVTVEGTWCYVCKSCEVDTPQ
jgi:hypothetical protein